MPPLAVTHNEQLLTFPYEVWVDPNTEQKELQPQRDSNPGHPAQIRVSYLLDNGD